MLKTLSLKNFKTWEDLNLELGNITVLFGTNSSGKSSIFQFLLMLKQTKDATDAKIVLELDESGKKLVNLGTYKDMVYQHDVDREIAWEMSWRFENWDEDEINEVEARLEYNGAEAPLFILRTAVAEKEGPITGLNLEYEFYTKIYKLKQEVMSNAYEYTFTDTSKSNELSELIALSGPTKTYKFPDELKGQGFVKLATYTHLSTVDLTIFESFYENLMDRLFYLGPLRSLPARQYIWSGSAPSDVGLEGENFVAAILAATQRGLKRRTGEKDSEGKYESEKTFQDVLGHWLKKIGLIHRFEVREVGEGSSLYRVFVQVSENSPEVSSLLDVGTGVSQFLPILVLLYYVPEYSIVLLEHPELHLHPSVQSGLADLILTVAECRNLQIIVESHSEHFLKRLQRRVAEEKVSSDAIKLYFCKRDPDQPVRSMLEPLNLDPYGYIINWPDHFFGDSFGEVFAIEDAGLSRKLKDMEEAQSSSESGSST